MMEELLLNYLKVACRGRDFCASSTELGRAIGVGRKTIQKLVSRLRRKKKPICSANSGYFYARTAQDINAVRAGISPCTNARADYS